MEYVTILERLKSNYVVLKDKFLCQSRPYVDGRPDTLNDLKSHYSSVINSPRTASYINNLEGLLRVLEKRNELSYDNIEPLIHIEARYVESPELSTLLRNYEGNMRDAPVVPLFNVYDALSGKYNVENGNISINTRHNWFPIPSNNQRLYRANNHDIHDEKTNRDTFNNEETRKNCATETASPENIPFDETNILLRNNSSTFDEHRLNHGLSDSNAFNVKILRRPAKHSIIVLVLTLLAATMFITLFLTIFNAQSSENSLESQPSIPNNVPSSGFVLQSPTTLPTLTPPSFHLTLSAPVQITAQRLPNHEEPQIARIVFLEVSDSLGRHWRDVARFLGVTEHDIDEIDSQPQLPLKEKALKALTKFQSKSDPAQWKSKLQQALEKARRRDLVEMAEELWSRKYQTT